MAGFDKEETITAVTAARDIFLRFGSTRIFAFAIFLVFLYGIALNDVSHTLTYGSLGFVSALALAFSLHRKPHSDRVSRGE